MTASELITPLSLRDYQQNRFVTVEHFATVILGIPTSTYQRLLEGRGNPSTMRKVAAALGVPPHAIAEFVPQPSQAYLVGLQRAVDRAATHGWLVGDAETGMPTDERCYDPIPHDDTLEE